MRFSSLPFALVLAGCATTADINDGFRKIDRVWQLEYQQTEDEYRFRVIEADYAVALLATRKAFLDLGMPIQATSVQEGVIIAENTAPTPLSREEWREVARVENPRLKAVSGLGFQLADDPSDYVVTVKATVRPLNGKTMIVLDYRLDAPKYRSYGFEPAQHAPATAVQLASVKFWSQLSKRLGEVKAPAPRKRSKQEIDA